MSGGSDLQLPEAQESHVLRDVGSTISDSHKSKRDDVKSLKNNVGEYPSEKEKQNQKTFAVKVSIKVFVSFGALQAVHGN